MRVSKSHTLQSRIRIVGMAVSHPHYASIAIVIALTILTISLYLQKTAILGFILTFPGYSMIDRWYFFLSTLFSFGFFTTALSKITVLVLSVLTGLYASLLWYFFAHRIASYRAGGLGITGIIMGLLGVGCTACGSVVLVSLVGFSAAGALFAVLPFRGAEIGIAGILVLISSLYFIAGKIQDPLICKINH